MNTYPFIGELKSGSGGVAIFANKESAAKLNLEGENWDSSDTYTYSHKWDEDQFKNITTEYLANTYGEVKSKEHAEFIVKLATNHGLRCNRNIVDDDFKYFYFNDDVLFLTTFKLSPMTDCKQITIPLPPKECLMEFDDREDEVSKGDDLKIARCKFDKAILKNYLIAQGLSSLAAGDLADCICKCKNLEEAARKQAGEWPKVNDDVFYNGQKWTFVAKHNDMAMLFWTGDEYCTAKVSELQKPKTPAEELQEDLIKIFDSSLDGGHFVDNLLSKYSLSKKPR